MAQYHCNYCQEDIQGLRIKCAECVDFDLCLQCFSCGAQIGCHRNDHSYQIINCGTFPIFNPPHGWKALEELKLLDAIEQYGFGNWDDVAEHVVSKETDDVREHYCNMYIVGNIGRLSWPRDVTFRPRDQTMPDGGPLSPSLSTQYPPLELTQQEQQELGYMPNRDDFEREFDNEAENLVSNLNVTQDEEDVDIALKLAHVDMYSRRLRERLRKKKIVRDYALVPQFYNVNNKSRGPGAKKKHSKEDKELQERLRVVTQFHSAQEHEQLFENMQKERELKLRIKELVRFRRNGLTRLDECSEFETAKYKRDRKKENKKKSGNSGTIHHRKSSMATKRPEEKNHEDTTTQEQTGNTGKDERTHEEEVCQEDFDIAALVGCELLSVREKKLCRSLRLRPNSYSTLKTVMMRDHLHRRQGIPMKTCYQYGLDKSLRRRIVNFMVSCGWITAP